MKTKLTVASISLVLSACGSLPPLTGAEQSAPPTAIDSIDPIRLGDKQLTCDELKAEVERMNNVVAVAEGRQPPTRTGEALANSATQVATNAAIAKGSMRAAQSIPFFGSLLSFAQTAKMGHDMNAQMQALNAKASATQRKYHLVGLYNQKDCR